MGVYVGDGVGIACQFCGHTTEDADMYICDSCEKPFCQDCAPHRCDDVPADYCDGCCSDCNPA